MPGISSRFVKKVALSCVVAGVFAASQYVRADFLQVQYYTVGQFDDTGAVVSGTGTFTTGTNNGSLTPSNPNYNDSSSLTITGSSPNSLTTLTYDYSGFKSPFLLNFPDPATLVGSGDLGKFTLSSNAADETISSTNGISFTLEIFQLLPPASGTSLVAEISGSVFFSGSEGSTVTATFVPGSATANSTPPVTYTLDHDPTTIIIGQTTVQAHLSAPDNFGVGSPSGAPLPAMASMGLTMFGLLGLGVVGRRLARSCPIAT